MEIVAQDNTTSMTEYVFERARAFGKSAEELQILLGGFGLFLSGESDTTPIAEWIDDVIDKKVAELIQDDPRIAQAQKDLDVERRNKGNEHLATERSRSTEWTVLLEKFIAVVPVTDSAVSAA